MSARSVREDWQLPRPRPSAELCELISTEYALTDVTVERDLGGSYHLNLAIRANEGTHVVRQYGAWVSAERLSAVQDVREFLRADGWPIAPLVPTRTERRFSALGDQLVEVEQFVPAPDRMNTWELLITGMQALGELHNSLRRAPVPPAARQAPYANHLPAEQVVDQTAPAIAVIREWDLTPEEEHYVVSAEQLAAKLQAIHDDGRPHLPRQLVHGDFWDNNVYFDGGRLVLLADFDFLGERPRIDDVALTLFATNERFGRDDVSAERLNRLRALVDAYDRALDDPLSPVERAHLPYAIARAPLPFLRDVAYGVDTRWELVGKRGLGYDWALRMVEEPHWQRAFV